MNILSPKKKMPNRSQIRIFGMVDGTYSVNVTCLFSNMNWGLKMGNLHGFTPNRWSCNEKIIDCKPSNLSGIVLLHKPNVVWGF
jgi:hypothetical protein